MLPESFVNRMKEMLGEEYEAFSEALKEERHQALRVNPLKAEPEDFARTGPFSLTPVPWATGARWASWLWRWSRQPCI